MIKLTLRVAALSVVALCGVSLFSQSAPGSKPARQLSEPQRTSSMTATELKYQEFFRELTMLDQVQASSSGNDAKQSDPIRTLLAPDQVLMVKLVAAHCVKSLNENGVAARREFGEFRAAYPAGRAMRVPPQLRKEHEEQAKRIVSTHVQQLKELLGEGSFAKVDQYVRSLPEPKTTLPPAPEAKPQ